ncbi:MAG: hypothetical protein LBQ50_06590 [Planctomycetaceae bacterium]|jgi:hypothetical protein|nr:hypothetical protein [Planctomycetaceae bacterium]
MSTQDYLPRSDQGLLVWAKNLILYASNHYSAMKIPEADVVTLQQQCNIYSQALTKAEEPNRGKLDVLEKNEAREVLKSALRKFVRGYLYNPAVTDVDRESMAVPLHDRTPSPRPAPNTHPVITTESKNPYELILHIRDSESTRRKKPDNAIGAVVYFKISDTPITDPSELTNSVLVTRSPYKLTFPPSERGKIVYMAARWENAKGEKGPWGEIISEVIS